MNILRTLLAALAMVMVLFASPAATIAAGGEPRVTIMTDQGTIEIALDAKHAPVSVANFLRYVDGKFYNGGTFFRAVPGFVIQGGNQEREKPSDVKIPLEPTSKTGLRHLDGTLSMARTSEPDSATSEFFICVGPQPSLDFASLSQPGYAAFGHVVSGMDIVRKIIAQPAPGQHLTQPVKIVKMTRKK